MFGFGSQFRPSAVFLVHRTAHRLRRSASRSDDGNLKNRLEELAVVFLHKPKLHDFGMFRP